MLKTCLNRMGFKGSHAAPATMVLGLRHCTALHSTSRNNTDLNYTLLHYTTLHYTTMHCTALHTCIHNITFNQCTEN